MHFASIGNSRLAKSLRSPVVLEGYPALAEAPSADLCQQVKRTGGLRWLDPQRLPVLLDLCAIILAIVTVKFGLNRARWRRQLLFLVLLCTIAEYLSALAALPA